MKKKGGSTLVYLIYFSTFIVALCSIAYELMFSQLLTILFGGTVKRYSITIGLFLFSLGIGSFLYTKINTEPRKFFVYIETAITLIGALGVFAIIKGSIWYIDSGKDLISSQTLILISYIPIIAVGIISGMEIPLLAELAQKHSKNKKTKFAEVLGVDYFGSLVGTVAFALLLYPKLGIVASVIVVSFMNLVLATIFALRLKKQTILKAITIVLVIIYLFTLPNMFTLQTELTKEFRGKRIYQHQMKGEDKLFDYEITDLKKTLYQDVIFTKIKLNPSYFSSDMEEYECLYLDNDMQLCENNIFAYHGGMIDVPMQYVDPKKEVEVLVIGGGDWIGINNLIQFPNVKNIDLIDIDKEFTEIAKVHPLISKYHNNSYDSEKLTIKYEDGFAYVLSANKKYDVIVLDLPGLNHDKLSHLYSVEFFSNINRLMNKDAVLVTWVYPKFFFETHAAIFDQVLFDSGFTFVKNYFGFNFNNNKYGTTENFYLVANKKLPAINISTKYLDQTAHVRNESMLLWEEFKDNGIKAHSIFEPNYDIVVKDGLL